MDETYCHFVGSYGLLKFATHKSPNPVSDFEGLNTNWYSNIHPHSILHVCSPALPEFVKKVLPSIQVPFKLLTNNSDCTIPNDFQSEADQILNHHLLEKWFSQNCIGNHPKLVRIPIGIDYHSMRPTRCKINKMLWDKPERNRFGLGYCKQPVEQEAELMFFRNSSKPFWERQIKGYGNFQFNMNHQFHRYGKVDRPDAIRKINKDLVFYEPLKATRDICWKNMTQYAFVISPWGNGLDCHRTWEALCLGCIPIVKTSELDPLFADLPVWIVQDWTDVNFDTMKQTIDEFKNKTFKYEKLTLSYWRNIMNE